MQRYTISIPLLAVMFVAPVGAQTKSAPVAAGSAPSAAVSADATRVPSMGEASYLYGVEFGAQLRALGIADKISPDEVMNGIRQGFTGSNRTTSDDVKAAQRFVDAQKQASGDGKIAPSEGPSNVQASRIYGVNFGSLLRRLGIQDELSTDSIATGLKDGLAGTKKSTPEDERRIRRYVQATQAVALEANKEAAQAFLARNRTQKGVETTQDGLQYKVLVAGDRNGMSPGADDLVTVQYRAMLLDGTEFDNSYKRGTPTTLPVNGVIKGWQEALPRMKPGSKWELFVPPELGYGDAPRVGIPAGSLLKFEMELVSVERPKVPPTTVPAPTAVPVPEEPPVSALN